MGGRVDVVGLGPAGPELIAPATSELLEGAQERFLRTRRHPAAAAVRDAEDFDDLYERADTFAEVYAGITDALLAAAQRGRRVVYAVPGSPTVAEATVELLARTAPLAGVDVVVHPAMSFLELAWARLGVDPFEARVRLVDGHRFAADAPSDGGAVLVAQCESRFTLSDVKLSVDPPPPTPVVLLQRLGLPDEVVLELDWADIDRSVEPDHLTSLWIPELPPSAGGRLEHFAALMARLRSDDPWKAQQTHESLKRFLLEEAHEVLEAIDSYDPATGSGSEELASELGDLLYQVVFHATVGEEAGWFELADVVSAIHTKLESRHPHLGSGSAPAVEDLVADWERAKREEHGRSSAFDGIPAGLPALLRALKLVRKAGALGLEVPVPPGEDTGSRLAAEAFAAAAQGIDPEDALRRTLAEVERRLRELEA